MLGRIKVDQLPEGKYLSDYKIGDVLHARIIDVYENKDRTYCVMSLKKEEELLDDWQKKLRDIVPTLKD